MRHLAPLALLILTGCLQAPSLEGGDLTERFLGQAPGASLASTCQDGAMTVAWAVSSHPLVDHYTAVLTSDGAEISRLELGFEGTGAETLDADTVAACDPGCTATLYPVDADGAVGVALFETTLGLDVDDDGVLSGFCGGPDCNDGDATVNPSATETCDGVDNDCSGGIDDLSDAPLATLQAGVCAGATQICDGAGGWAEPDYSAYSTDYAAVEICDGLDNDCSGQADDLPGAPLAAKQHGVCSGARQVCDGSGGWIEPDYTGFSSDYNASVDECDGLDNDCDNDVDDAAAPAGDLIHGVCAGATKTCDGTNGWIEPDYSAHSSDYAAIDDCDGLDNDCNDAVDDTPIASVPAATKTDGVCVGQVKSCNGTAWEDPDYTTISGYEAVEASCDSFDNDCDGTADNIAGAPPADKQDGVCAGAEQICDGSGGWIEPDYGLYSDDYHATLDDCDGLDNDCDNDVDDAAAPAGDLIHGVCAGATKTCDGTNGWLEPDYSAHSSDYAAIDDCDGLDNDCNEVVDDTPTANIPLGAVQDGVCAGATKACVNNAWAEPNYGDITDYQVSEDRCDSLDNDCDGAVDDIPNAPLATLQFGVCTGAIKVCDGQGGWDDPDYSDFSADYALIDDCDGLDNDCNDSVDDSPASAIPAALLQDGVCSGAEQICAGAGGWIEPDYATSVANYESVEETCDDLDNDCDTRVDTVFQVVPDSTVLECFGNVYPRPIEKVDEGPWKQVYGVRNTWGYVSEGYSCAIDMNDALHCWGNNDFGELGDGTTQKRRTIQPVAGNMTWKTANLGNSSTCAIASDDTLWCWGLDAQAIDAILTPTQVGSAAWKDVSIGVEHRCALATDDSLWCWGTNNNGQLGLGDNNERTSPTRVGTALYKQVSAGGNFTCALQTDDSLWCWGENRSGQFAVDPSTTSESTVPLEVSPPNGLTWVEISAGYSHTCALASDSNVYCWGLGSEQAIGNGSNQDDVYTPTQALGGPFTSLISADYQTCADDAAGNLWCWGTNGEHNLIPGEPYYLETPTLVATDLILGEGLAAWHTCALDAAGALYCWGRENPGTGPGPEAPSVVDAPTPSKVTVGVNHLCLLDVDGAAWCMGSGPATGSTDLALTRVDTTQISGIAAGPFTEIAAGNGATCALDVDGHRWCWGSNRYLQFGFFKSDTYEPYEDNTGVSFSALSQGYRHGCGIVASDNTLTCWGEGFAVYTELMSDTEQFDAVSTGTKFTCVIDTSGVLSCWGRNNVAQLGNGDRVDRTFTDRTPMAGGPWRSVSASSDFACGTKMDDTAWCWGRNRYGQLGVGDTTDRLEPTQVPGVWTDIQTGSNSACGTKADGSVWCWGDNQNHQLGTDFLPIESSTPMQVSTTPVTSLHAGGNRRCSTRETYTEQVCE
ncbi:MAG: hypothetical protein KC912_19965 [Proteobacteria bacterium]|nr:hypothetical protein [Pseudomonadota bacterium]